MLNWFFLIKDNLHYNIHIQAFSTFFQKFFCSRRFSTLFNCLKTLSWLFLSIQFIVYTVQDIHQNLHSIFIRYSSSFVKYLKLLTFLKIFSSTIVIVVCARLTLSFNIYFVLTSAIFISLLVFLKMVNFQKVVNLRVALPLQHIHQNWHS